jgi:hypothetical protein
MTSRGMVQVSLPLGSDDSSTGSYLGRDFVEMEQCSFSSSTDNEGVETVKTVTGLSESEVRARHEAFFAALMRGERPDAKKMQINRFTRLV